MIKSMATADFYHPDWQPLLIFFAIQGLKISGMAEDWTHNFKSYSLSYAYDLLATSIYIKETVCT